MTDLEKLKFNLQEEKYPYFTNNELINLLEEFEGLQSASYQGCMIKSQDDSVKLGPINTVSNEKYWLRRARMFKTSITGVMKRVDEL